MLAALAFLATHPVNEEYARYGLLVILVPVGITAVLLALEPRAWIRRGVVCAVLAWSCVPALDTARLAASYAALNGPAELRTLTDLLVARRTRRLWLILDGVRGQRHERRTREGRCH